MFTLILYIYAGAFAKGDNVAIENVPGFQTKALCEAAKTELSPLTSGSVKEIRMTCIKVKEQ